MARQLLKTTDVWLTDSEEDAMGMIETAKDEQAKGGQPQEIDVDGSEGIAKADEECADRAYECQHIGSYPFWLACG